jgi:four helix bundle protein
MPTSFEDLRVLKATEVISDSIYESVIEWNDFARDVVGKQISRSADSIGANVVESFGRFHYGEKLQFSYYARGSVFETKYWLNRASARELLPQEVAQRYASQLTEIARQLNLLVASLKGQRTGEVAVTKTLRESPVEEYTARLPDDFPNLLFDVADLVWLES